MSGGQADDPAPVALLAPEAHEVFVERAASGSWPVRLSPDETFIAVLGAAECLDHRGRSRMPPRRKP